MDQRIPKPDWLDGLDFPDLHQNYDRHFSETHISAAQHSENCRIDLGVKVLAKRRIYLDQSFWIYCRDAYLGNPERKVHAKIWNTLCDLVDSGIAICPVAYPILIETYKQGDRHRRKATATVIDRLCCNVALQPFLDLCRIELFHLFTKLAKGADAVFPLKQLVWTYPGWIVGEMPLYAPAFDALVNNAIQKCMFDILSRVPFSNVINATIDNNLPNTEDSEQYYSRLNADSIRHRHEVTSFEVVFMSEIAGALDTMKLEIAEMLRNFCMREKKQAPSIGSPELSESVRQTSNLIYHAFSLKKLTVDFPILHIGAGLHAAKRHRQQPYKRGDHWDHKHAHSALAYCDAFLTEKSMGNLLCTPPLNYDSAYGCRVLWNEDEALAYLSSLLNGQS